MQISKFLQFWVYLLFWRFKNTKTQQKHEKTVVSYMKFGTKTLSTFTPILGLGTLQQCIAKYK